MPVDDLLTLQGELAEARTVVDRLNTELRDKRFTPEGSRNETLVNPKLLQDMQKAAVDLGLQNEVNAIEQWFRVSDEGQGSVALHTLLQHATRAQLDLVRYALRQPELITTLPELMSTVFNEGSYRGVTFTRGELPERGFHRPSSYRGPAIIVDRTSPYRYGRPPTDTSSSRPSQAGTDDTWRSSGRSSHSSWSQRSSTSSVFSRRTNRTSASSAHLDMPYRDLMELGAVFPNASTRRSQAFNSQLKGRVPPTTQEHEQAGRGVGASTESDEVLSEREIQKESRDSSGGH